MATAASTAPSVPATTARTNSSLANTPSGPAPRSPPAARHSRRRRHRRRHRPHRPRLRRLRRLGSPANPLLTFVTDTNPSEIALRYAAVPAQLPDNRAAFVNTMLENLYIEKARTDLLLWGPWLVKVPAQLGKKVTLDSAMCTLTLHLLGKFKCNAAMVGQSRILYGQSLGALQQALNHPDEWKTSETLCATMILCMYEVCHPLPPCCPCGPLTPRQLFADTSGTGSWMKHAGGVSSLISSEVLTPT